MKACDCFVFSSFYEGLGLVLMEAAALGLPVFSTRIEAVEKFMETYGGPCVDNSEEGLLEGMRAFAEGRIKPMQIDFEAFNKRSLDAFENLLQELG